MKKTLLLSFLCFYAFINSNFLRVNERTAAESAVSLHLLEAETADVIRLLADFSGKNIAIDGSVRGKITLDLKEVDFENALKVILDNSGYSFLKEGDIYRVLLKDKISKDIRLKKKIYSLEYASSENIKPIVTSFLSAEGSLITDNPHNTIIITDTEEKLKEIEGYLKKIDIPVPQVAIEARILETSLGRNRRNAVTWDLIKNYAEAESSDSEGDVTGVLDFSKKAERGKRFNFQPDGTVYGVISTANLELIMDKLKRDTRTNFVSCPNVTTLNNEQAVIEITTTKAVSKETSYETEGKRESTNIRTANVGIRMSVTPYITKNNLINLKVEPSISSAKKSELFPDEAMDVTESKANTSILINDGETLVIGGLISTQEEEVTKKLPFFSDIPYIGERVFTQKDKTWTNKELTIFVTTRILKVIPEDKNREVQE